MRLIGRRHEENQLSPLQTFSLQGLQSRVVTPQDLKLKSIFAEILHEELEFSQRTITAFTSINYIMREETTLCCNRFHLYCTK